MSLSSVWDGTSESRPDPNVFRAPDAADYERIVRELRETQAAVLAVDARFAAEAAELIRAGNVVRIRETDGKLKRADSATTGLAAGVALNTAIVNNVVLFVQVGNVELPDWSLVSGTVHLSIGRPYYLGPSGSLSTTPVSTGYHVKIGLAVTTNILAVKISESVRL